MQRGTVHIRRYLAAMALFALAACTNVVDRHGYAPTDAQLDEIVVGVDTKDSVAETVGQPSVAGILSGSGWYYVESRFETLGPFEKQEIDRQVVAITFDAGGVVRNIERFGLEDGNAVVLSRRVTSSNIQGVTFLRQLLGNVGNFAVDQLNI